MRKTLLIAGLSAVTSLFIATAASATIPTSNVIDVSGFCTANSPAGGVGGNFVISSNDVRITYVMTPNGRVNATCHFLDTSGVFEDQAAEQQKLDECFIYLGYGQVFVGTGHIVAAADRRGPQPGSGGTATFVCKATESVY